MSHILSQAEWPITTTIQKGGSSRFLVAVGPLLSSPGSLTRWPANSDNPRPQEPRELGLPTALQEWPAPVYSHHSRAGLSLPFSSRFS